MNVLEHDLTVGAFVARRGERRLVERRQTPDRRRRGRPRIGHRVSVRFPDALYDEMRREARDRAVDLTYVIRERCERISDGRKSGMS